MRPSLSTEHYLTGAAKRIWNKDLQKWRDGSKFHFILWGPPGSGKTTLARLLGETCNTEFIMLSAVRDGVKEIRKAVDQHPQALIFIDEIHRLSKSQQDTLLPILEYAEAWIVGATTESPQTALTAPFLSRVRSIYISAPTKTDVITCLENGLKYLTESEHKIFTAEKIDRLQNETIPKIAKMSAGDIRFGFNLFETIANCENTDEEESIYKNSLKAFTSKNHYNYVSAMIKSMRGSDPDAALFYAITALDAGEDALFIVRRCIIFASEDVGNADPQALTLATSTYKAIECVGMPEGRIPLAQCVTYLASTVKSNRAYIAIDKVRKWKAAAEENGASYQPPRELTLKGSELYKYPHDYENAFVHFDYLPNEILKIKKSTKEPAYLPSDYGVEARLKNRLIELWEKK